VLGIVAAASGLAEAIDHKNLDESQWSYEFLTDSKRTERDGRHELALGASYPIGAPKFTRATLVADVFADQPVTRPEETIMGKVGLTYQLKYWTAR